MSILAWLNNQIDWFLASQTAQIWSAVFALLIVCMLVSEARTVRQTTKFENSLRLLIGKYNLYSPEDTVALNERASDLFELYIESLIECGKPVYDRQAEMEHFMTGFFHGYVVGRRVMERVSSDERVVKAFEKRFYSYLENIR